MIRTAMGAFLAGVLCTAGAHGLECSSDEVGYFATFKVNPGSEDQFEALALELTDKVRALEPGVVFYAPYQGSEPGVYHFMERYENEAARSAHAKAEEIRAVFGKVMPLLRERLEVETVSALCP